MRKALGSKSGTPTKKGTWGGSYQIDYGKYSSKVSCYTCVNCVDESKSCRKYGMFIPVLGKNTWRGCKYFSLSLDYATEENCDYVKHIKGNDFIQKEVSQREILKENTNKKQNKKTKSKDATSNSKIVVPEDIIENVVMICINKKVNPISIFKLAMKHIKNDSFDSITFDSVITNLLNSTIKNDSNRAKLTQLIYQLSKELDVSMVKILNLDLNSKRNFSQELLESNRYTTISSIFGVDQYNLVPKDMSAYESTDFFNNEFFSALEQLPFYGNCLDDVLEDDFKVCEDYKYIVVYDPTACFETNCEFDLLYSFPVYYQQEYIEQQKKEYCVHCGNNFDSKYLSKENYHEWVCPKCHSQNDIYKRYCFKKIYAPQPTDLD